MSDQGYIRMLRESLEKKVRILTNIEAANEDQERILKDAYSTPDELDENMETKDRLVDEIIRLDNGFQEMYDHVREALQKDKSAYADDIRAMQELIREITDRSNHVKMQEQANKRLAEAKFSGIREKAREIRKNEKAVSTYYRNMMKIDKQADPMFLDSKK